MLALVGALGAKVAQKPLEAPKSDSGKTVALDASKLKWPLIILLIVIIVIALISLLRRL